MDTVEATFILCFEEPFWVGIYQRKEGSRFSAAKVTFGAEPKSYEVYSFLMAQWRHLSFSPPLKDLTHSVTHKNPKRVQREIKRELRQDFIGTKSQQALSLQHTEGKAKRRRKSREQREAEKDRLFQQHQAKRKEKHKGH